MSARKYPRWLPPAAFVGFLGLALLLSNQSPTMPDGKAPITSEAEYQEARVKMQDLSITRLSEIDGGKTPTPDDLKKLREAGEIIDRMNAFAPTASGLQFLAGRIHFALNEDENAERSFRQCVLLAPNDALAKPAEAQAIRLTAAEASYQLSLLLLVRRDVPGALKAADEAVSAVPQSSNYLTARASALNELRRIDEAKRDLKQALKIDPNNPRAKSLLRFISKQ